MRNISALRKVFAEHGGPNYIDTIPRRGYRFNADVRVESEEKSRRRSVALLPWRLQAGEVRSVAIGSAVIEATITKLSAVRECAVHPSGAITRHSDDDPIALGRELRVDFVLDGSIRLDEHKGRVSVRLMSTTDGAVVWADTLEKRCDDIFAFEDSISDELAGALALILTPRTGRPIRRTSKDVSIGRCARRKRVSVRAHFILGLAREQQGRMAEAMTAFETAVAVSRGRIPAMLGALGDACARIRNNDAAAQALHALDELPPEVTSWAKALVRLGMDDHCEALRLIRCACDSREFGLVTIGVDNRLAPLRQSADFQKLLERVGLNG